MRSRTGRGTLRKAQYELGDRLKGPVRVGVPSGPFKGSPNPSLTSLRVPRPVRNPPVGPPTRLGPLGGSPYPSRTSLWVSRPVLDLPVCPPTHR